MHNSILSFYIPPGLQIFMMGTTQSKILAVGDVGAAAISRVTTSYERKSKRFLGPFYLGRRTWPDLLRAGLRIQAGFCGRLTTAADHLYRPGTSDASSDTTCRALVWLRIQAGLRGNLTPAADHLSLIRRTVPQTESLSRQALAALDLVQVQVVLAGPAGFALTGQLSINSRSFCSTDWT